VTEIETGKKPGSLDAMRQIAAALGLSLGDLGAWLSARASTLHDTRLRKLRRRDS